MYLFVFTSPAVWWLYPHAWAVGLIRALSTQRSPTCSSTTFVGLGREETGCLLGLFAAQPSRLPVGRGRTSGSPRGNDTSWSWRQNLPAGTSQSTMNGLGPGPGFPPPPAHFRPPHPLLGAGAVLGLGVGGGERDVFIWRILASCLDGTGEGRMALTGAPDKRTGGTLTQGLGSKRGHVLNLGPRSDEVWF